MAGEKEEEAQSEPTAKHKTSRRGRLRKRTRKSTPKGHPSGTAAFPRHAIKKALRIPKAIMDQNAGRSCSEREAVKFAGIAYHGPSRVEISSSIKYGLLERPRPGNVAVTDLAKRILRPQNPTDEVDGLRQAVLNAPTVADVYKHYRGENVPDDEFFRNALVDTFGLPADKTDEFKAVFFEDLSDAQLIEDVDGKKRILDVARDADIGGTPDETLKKISKGVKIEQGDTCFVMMPFIDPIGGYYKSIYESAIGKAGLKPVRADDEIFATGKIIGQV